MNSPTISIVLCTFNGAKFLEEQLLSLRAQTLQPTEIILQDDASTDSSREIIARFSDLPIKMEVNKSRLGFAKNFSLALARAKGELLFLCDQDDVWEASKIEKMAGLFAKFSGVDLVFSDCSLMRADGALLPRSILEQNALEISEGIWPAEAAAMRLLRQNPIPGMAMAVRSSLARAALPIPAAWEHDYWLVLAAAARGGLAYTSERLVRYRQHADQAIGAGSGLGGRWRRAQAEGLASLSEKSAKYLILSQYFRALKPELAKQSQAKAQHLAKRSAYASFRPLRVWPIFSELLQGNYHRFENGYATALKDLLARS